MYENNPPNGSQSHPIWLNWVTLKKDKERRTTRRYHLGPKVALDGSLGRGQGFERHGRNNAKIIVVQINSFKGVSDDFSVFSDKGH